MTDPQNKEKTDGTSKAVETLQGLWENYGDVTGRASLPVLVSYALEHDGMADVPPAVKRLLMAAASVPAAKDILVPNLIELWEETLEGDGEARADLMMNGVTSAVLAAGVAKGDPHYIQTASLLLFLFEAAGSLEDNFQERVSGAIEEMMDILPDEVQAKRNGRLLTLAREDLQPGDVVTLQEGAIMPANGRIIHASDDARIDVSSMTGETRAETAHAAMLGGAEIVQGCDIAGGSIDVQITATSEDSYIEQHVESMLEGDDSARESQYKHVVNRWVDFLMVLSAAKAGKVIYEETRDGNFSPAEGDFGRTLDGTLNTIIAGLPCSAMAALLELNLLRNRLLQDHNINIRSNGVLESMEGVRRIVTDITGTLTTGEDELQEFVVQHADAEDTKELQRLVASLEQGDAGHHIAGALLKSVDEKDRVASADIENFENIMDQGRGLKGVLEGWTIHVGNEALFEQQGDVMPREFASTLREAAEAGMSHAIFKAEKNGKTHWGYFTTQDQLRDGVQESIEQLHRDGVEVWLCTGGSQEKANYFAEKLGISAEHVYANMQPTGEEGELTHKVGVIGKAKRDAQGPVVFIGDALNDAPALQRVQQGGMRENGVLEEVGIGVAMGDVGTRMMTAQADIVTDQGITAIDRLRHVSATVNKEVKRNFSVAGAYIAMLTGSSMFDRVTKVAPTLMAVFHELPTLLMTAYSAMRATQLSNDLHEGDVQTARPIYAAFSAFMDGVKQFRTGVAAKKEQLIAEAEQENLNPPPEPQPDKNIEGEAAREPRRELNGGKAAFG